MTHLVTAVMDEGIAAVPIAFGPSDAWCFGWFHAARAPARGVGVVLCRPVGFEGHCTYEMYTQLAEYLAVDGFAVIRFDYHGTGDSAGNDADPDRVPTWIDSTLLATNEVKRLGGVSRIAMFGVRLGATLAAKAASMSGGIESLVMWAPCVTGRAFERELRASSSCASSAAVNSAPVDIQALGYTYTGKTLQDLSTLDCLRLDVPPAKRVMIIGRDDMPIEGPLPAAYKAMGLDTTYTVLPGYSSMMVEPHNGSVEQATLGLISHWLGAGQELEVPLRAYGNERPAAPASGDSVAGGVREIPLVFGPQKALFGILAEPAQILADDRRSDTAILMVTVAANHRIGPNRLHVELARSWASGGYRAFRFDLTGIGDSRSEAGFPGDRFFYSKDTTKDVQSAIDCLAARGCTRFVVMGLCSGAYGAFQTALADRRVAGQILINPRRLEWQVGSTLQSAMQTTYKSIHYYRRALLDVNVYRRTLRGEVDLKGIARRIGLLVEARLKRVLNRILQREPIQEDLLANLKTLSARGTDTLMIIGAEDDGRDYIEFHLGHRGGRLRHASNFRIAFIEGSDHTFTTLDSQQFVIAMVQTHLDDMALHQATNLPGKA